jgi:hypothetical protein
MSIVGQTAQSLLGVRGQGSGFKDQTAYWVSGPECLFGGSWARMPIGGQRPKCLLEVMGQEFLMGAMGQNVCCWPGAKMSSEGHGPECLMGAMGHNV